jgi:hypothetical protein
MTSDDPPHPSVFRKDDSLSNKNNKDDELSIPETIEICKSYSSSFGTGTLSDDDNDTIVQRRLDLSFACDYDKMKDSSVCSHEQGDDHKKIQKDTSGSTTRQRALFTLEIGICLVFVIGMAIIVAVLWCRFTEEPIERK